MIRTSRQLKDLEILQSKHDKGCMLHSYYDYL
jgi:hypothetical protein